MCVVKNEFESGNKFCTYFVDLIAVNLVSWIFIIVVFLRELFIKLCRFDKIVLSDEVFQVIMFVLWLVLVLVLGAGVEMFGSGGKCGYSFMFSKQRSDSVISLFGRKMDFLWSVIGVSRVFWL
jgi:hypothetical protein